MIRFMLSLETRQLLDDMKNQYNWMMCRNEKNVRYALAREVEEAIWREINYYDEICRRRD